jgi:hypothetical protein
LAGFRALAAVIFPAAFVSALYRYVVRVEWDECEGYSWHWRGHGSTIEWLVEVLGWALLTTALFALINVTLRAGVSCPLPPHGAVVWDIAPNTQILRYSLPGPREAQGAEHSTARRGQVSPPGSSSSRG